MGIGSGRQGSPFEPRVRQFRTRAAADALRLACGGWTAAGEAPLGSLIRRMSSTVLAAEGARPVSTGSRPPSCRPPGPAGELAQVQFILLTG